MELSKTEKAKILESANEKFPEKFSSIRVKLSADHPEFSESELDAAAHALAINAVALQEISTIVLRKAISDLLDRKIFGENFKIADLTKNIDG